MGVYMDVALERKPSIVKVHTSTKNKDMVEYRRQVIGKILVHEILHHILTITDVVSY